MAPEESAPSSTMSQDTGSTLSQQPSESHSETVDTWQSSLPTELKNHQGLQKFKDVSDLAKSYVEVESMVGRKGVILPEAENAEDRGRFFNELGRPESPDGYNAADFEAGAWGDLPFDDEAAGDANMRELFHEVGLTQEQVTRFQAGMKERLGAAREKRQLAEEVHRDGSIRALREKFGNSYDDRILAAQQAIRAAAGDSADSIVEMQMADGTLLGDNPAFIEMFANLGGKMAEHGLVGGKRASVPTMDPLTAQQRLTELMSDPDYLEALNTKTHPGHALAVKQREDLFGAMHPEGA